MIGVQRAVISKYERGMIEPSPAQFQHIANALGVPVSSFFDEQELTFDLAANIAQVLSLITILYENGSTPANIKRFIEVNSPDIDELKRQLATVSIKAYRSAEIDAIRNLLNDEGWKRVLEFAEEMTQIPKYQQSQPTNKNKPRPEPRQEEEKP